MFPITLNFHYFSHSSKLQMFLLLLSDFCNLKLKHFILKNSSERKLSSAHVHRLQDVEVVPSRSRVSDQIEERRRGPTRSRTREKSPRSSENQDQTGLTSFFLFLELLPKINWLWWFEIFKIWSSLDKTSCNNITSSLFSNLFSSDSNFLSQQRTSKLKSE